MRKIAIASDHAGFKLKDEIKKIFGGRFELIDFGPVTNESMDYPDTGIAASEAVSKGDCELGILICGSGIGMSIVANKVKGVRAALVYTMETAKLSKQHNNANVLVLAGRFISKYHAEKVIEIWLATEFEGGRHQKRLDKIKTYENAH